jgi:hypothetical protein
MRFIVGRFNSVLMYIVNRPRFLKHFFSCKSHYEAQKFEVDAGNQICPHYTCISRRAKEVEVSFKTKTREAIQHLAIDATVLKVYGKGE